MRTSRLLGARDFQEMALAMLNELNDADTKRRLSQAVGRSFELNLGLARGLLEAGSQPANARGRHVARVLAENARENVKLGLTVANDLLAVGERLSARVARTASPSPAPADRPSGRRGKR